MNILWIILGSCIAIAVLIDNRDRDFRAMGSDKRDLIFTMILILVLGFFWGLRVDGNDTATYLYTYETMPNWDDFSMETHGKFSKGMGFNIVLSLMKSSNITPQNFLMIFAFLTAIPYVLFAHRHTRSMVFCVFLMFTTGVATFPMAAIKQAMATGLCLMATTCAAERRWLGYVFFMILAVLFHPYALIYLMVPFLMFRPWSPPTFALIGVSLAAGIYMESLLGTVLDITDMMGADYDAQTFAGQGVNFFRVAINFIPIGIAVLSGKYLFRDFSRTENLIFNMAMVNALIMFVGMFGTANYFARLANYFLPAQCLTLPTLLRRQPRENRLWLTAAIIVGYLGYFYYENGIIRPFEQNYTHMTLWDYLLSLL